MSYKALVNSNVTLAFNLIKDLAEDVILVKSSDNDFDFETATASEKTVNISTKAVVIKDAKKSKAHNAIKRQVMFKTRNLGDLTAYDRVMIEGKEWRFGPMINNDGYTVLAEVYREV